MQPAVPVFCFSPPVAGHAGRPVLPQR